MTEACQRASRWTRRAESQATQLGMCGEDEKPTGPALEDEHGMGHGHANAIVAYTLAEDRG